MTLTTFTYVKVGDLTVERIYLRTLLPLGHRAGDPRLREEIAQGCLDSGTRVHRATLSNHLGEILEHFSFPNTDKEGEPETLTDADILAIAGRVESCPVSPWWLKDDVVIGDVQAAVLRFARALLAAHREQGGEL